MSQDDVAKMSDFDSFNVATTVNVEAVATTGGSVHPGDTMHPGGGTSAAGDLACSDDDDDGTASVISAAVSQVRAGHVCVRCGRCYTSDPGRAFNTTG